jgi:copper chaperone CopZ
MSKFTSTIKCAGCIATVTPGLNELVGQGNWEVDLHSPDRVLTINNTAITVEEVIHTLQKVGYRAEPIL